MLILGIFRRDLGSGRVCNGWEMAVGFKWTDSQPISINMSPFWMIFMILVGCRSGMLLSYDNFIVFQCVHLEESASHPLPLPEGVPKVYGKSCLIL